MPALSASAEEQYEIRKGMAGFVYRLLIGFGILVLLSAVILVAGKLYGRSLIHAGHTASTQVLSVQIGDDALIVPANMMRIEQQRRDGPANRLDLYLHWPTLSGFRDDLATAFNDIEPTSNSIVFASIVEKTTALDMADRFDAVYRHVMSGSVTDAGNGLQKARLSADHGYIDEYIVFSAPDRQTGRRFVVRCQDAEAAAQTIVAPCETDIQFGASLSAEIRFPSRLLEDWSRLNAKLPAFLDALLAGGERP